MFDPKSVSILGLGWLGLPLAKSLHRAGFNVQGSVSSQEKFEQLKDWPFIVTRIQLRTDGIEGDWKGFLDGTDVLIINVPPGRKEGVERSYPALVDQIIDHTPLTLNVLFTSTIGVYADENQTVNENTKPNPRGASGKAMLDAEKKLIAHFGDRLTILRLAGLIGEDRHPGKFLAGKKGLENGNVHVNLVHRDDCIKIIRKVIEKDAWGEIINVCASQHPIRKDFYQQAATDLGLVPPQFNPSSKDHFKIIDNSYSKELLDYEYRYDNPDQIFSEK